MNKMIKHQTITNMVHVYTDASQKIEQAFKLLEDANAQMLSAFGEYSGVYYRIRNEDLQLELKQKTWREIISQTGMLEVMTEKKKNEFEKQIENDKAPDITVDTVWGTLMSLRNNVDNLLVEAIRETYEWLRPCNNNYKTNSEYKVGQKVILEYCVDYEKHSWGEMMSLYYRKEQNIRSLDNVFHLLDGKGVVKYPGDFLTQIKDAIRRKEWSCETEYFRARWYKKGTMHIELKRQDLINELNKIAGSGQLPKEGIAA